MQRPVFYKKMPKHCVVVGGGAAGLSCAGMLLASSVRVTLLEAGGRVGGRCRTAPILSGRGACEHGASFFHGQEGNPAFELCDSLGLLPAERQHRRVRRRRLVLRSDGKPADQDAVRDVKAVMHRAIEECEDGRAASSNVGEHAHAAWAAARPGLLSVYDSDAPLLDAAWQAAESMQCAIDGCSTLREQGTAAYANYDEFDHKFGSSRPETGGFGAAMDALAAPLHESGSLLLGRAARLIRYDPHADSEGGVEVICEGGESFHCDTVCITVPLEPLKRLRFEPPLPEQKRGAVECMALGKVEKVYIELEPTGGRDAAADNDRGGDAGGGPEEISSIELLWTAKDAPGGDGQVGPVHTWTRGLHHLYHAGHEALPDEVSEGTRSRGVTTVLVGWVTGMSARDVSGRAPEELLAEVVAGLAPFWEQIEWRPVRCHATSWSADERFGGAWSFPTVGCPADVSDSLSAPLLSSSGQPLVLFAGEATSRAHFGTVGGALLSGRREAARLLQAWDIDAGLWLEAVPKPSRRTNR